MLGRSGSVSVIEPCGLSFASLGKLSDDVLMAHVRAGDGDALAVVFDRYHRLVFSIAFKVLRNTAEAQDVSQTIFMEIFRNAVRFDASRGSIKVWLLQYAYHRSLNRLRYLNVRAFEQSGEFADAGERAGEEAFRVNTVSLNLPERTLLVRQALSLLTDSQRRTLELAFFEGLSINEICERTNMSRGNVRHHYYRGLKRLKTYLQEETAAQSTAAPVREIANV